jgi:hypothetical protein
VDPLEPVEPAGSVAPPLAATGAAGPVDPAGPLAPCGAATVVPPSAAGFALAADFVAGPTGLAT